MGAGMVIDSHFLVSGWSGGDIDRQWLSVPVVMTARGSDVTLLRKYRIPRGSDPVGRLVLQMRIVTVSASLRATTLRTRGRRSARTHCIAQWG